VLEVPYFDNLFDQYRLIASAPGFEDSAWYPVHVNKDIAVELHLMFLPKDGGLNFHDATWDRLSQSRSNFAAVIRRGCENEPAGAEKYQEIQEKRPQSLACFLNLMTALSTLKLPSGRFALDYYWNVAWPRGDAKTAAWLSSLDQVLQPDRMFCYVDRAILDEARNGVGHGFSKEPNPEAWGHKGATESYKQTQFELANLQLTFHGGDVANFTDENGKTISCVKVEPDIDFYRDPVAHTLVEFLPNWITKRKTDPRVVYWMRWMTAKREGLAEFDPLFVVEPAAAAATTGG
jgi:hypothetical protein